MDGNGQDYMIATTAELEKLYSDAPYGPAVFKETDHITPQYRKLIEAAPFAVLATMRPGGARLLAARRSAGLCARGRRTDAAHSRPPRQ